MAYNNGFPMNYGYQMPPQQVIPQQIPTPQPQSNGLLWVQGEAGAKSYLVAPNNTVDLWDSEAPVIYLKSADASGMPSMKILDYTIRDASNMPLKTPLSSKVGEYATKEELEALKAEITAKLDELKESEGV